MKKKSSWVDICVGSFIMAGIVSLIFLSIMATNMAGYTIRNPYHIHANFDNVGQIKLGSLVKIAGVVVGKVYGITLNKSMYTVDVDIAIDGAYKIPSDSSISVYTTGLLGDQFLSIEPGYAKTYLDYNSIVMNTSSAIVLEQLISSTISKLSSAFK